MARSKNKESKRSFALTFAFCLLTFSCLLLVRSQSQTDPLTLHRWGAVTLFHGMPSDRVRAVAQGPDGAMWFGTDAGLARYDGRRILTAGEEGLDARRVLALRFDEAGALWVGTEGGALLRSPTGEWRALAETTGKSVTAVLTPERGRALLATGDGVVFECRTDDRGTLEVRTLAEARAAAQRNTARDGATRGGAAREAAEQSGGGPSSSATAPPSSSSSASSSSITRRDAATARGGATSVARELEPTWITSLAVAGGKVLVGTRGRGLLVVEGGTMRELLTRPRPFFVEALAADAQGNVFVGTQASGSDSGLFKLDSSSPLEASSSPRLSKVQGATGVVTALGFGAPGGRGDLFAGTDGRGVFHYGRGEVGDSPERFTFAGTAGGLRSDRVYAAFVDREGVAWFGTDRGVCRYDPKGVSVEPLSAETEGNFVRSIYRTRAGRLLVGTNRGLYVRDARTPSSSSTTSPSSASWRVVEEVAGKTVYAIAEDRAGALLVGTGAGLYVGVQPEGRREAPAVKLKPEAKGAPKEGQTEGAQTTPGGEGETGGGPAAPAPDEQTDAAPQTESPGAANDANDANDATGGAGEEKKSEPPARKVPEPALRGSVRAIAVFGGAVYVASFGRGVERFDGFGRRALVWPKAGDERRGRETVSLYADDANGRLWFGTANAGAFYFDGREVRSDAALAPLSTSTVWALSGAGEWLWLATARGLYAHRRGSSELLEIAPGLDARGVVAVGDGRAPQAWCATAGGGVLKVTIDEEFGVLTGRLDAEQGLPSQSAFAVLPLADDEGAAEPTLLVGTTKGLARYEPGAVPPSLTLTRVTASRTHQPEELRERVLVLDYPQNGLVLDVAANASRTFPEQFQYSFLLQDREGRAIKKKLSHDSQFQAESLPAGRYRVTARAYTVDLTPSAPLHFDFEVSRAPFPRTIVALSLMLGLALVTLLWVYLQHRKIVRSRKELLDANRQLAAARLQLANEAESERRRIARDLHDQTLADLRRLLLLTDEMQCAAAPNVSGVTNVSGVSGDGPTNGDGQPAAPSSTVDPSELRAEIESISHEVRRICEDLSPSVLENVGFAAALEWSLTAALAHLPADCKFTYDFTCDENLEERLRLAPAVQMQLYRIVQEAVSNVCRHAQAARVRLRLHATEEGDLLLELEDDGRGFDPSDKRARTGRGLAGIRARAHMIDAEVRWARRPEPEGGGTVFTLRKTGAARHTDAAPHEANA